MWQQAEFDQQAQNEGCGQPEPGPQRQAGPDKVPFDRAEPGAARQQSQQGVSQQTSLQTEVNQEQHAPGHRAAGKQELSHRGPPVDASQYDDMAGIPAGKPMLPQKKPNVSRHVDA